MCRNERPGQSRLRFNRDLAAACLVGALAFWCSGCGEEEMKGGPRVEVVPVTGKVLVDGKPGKGVVVDFYRVGVSGVDFAVPQPQGVTDENGNLTLSTYLSGDGGAPGEYKLVFQLGTAMNPISGEVTGDAFRGKYSDPRKSKHKATIPEEAGDEPHNIGTFELTTKGD
jgi:5-hydroxyisourate hydrolase-like protein (transthyretin family)